MVRRLLRIKIRLLRKRRSGLPEVCSRPPLRQQFRVPFSVAVLPRRLEALRPDLDSSLRLAKLPVSEASLQQAVPSAPTPAPTSQWPNPDLERLDNPPSLPDSERRPFLGALRTPVLEPHPTSEMRPHSAEARSLGVRVKFSARPKHPVSFLLEIGDMQCDRFYLFRCVWSGNSAECDICKFSESEYYRVWSACATIADVAGLVSTIIFRVKIDKRYIPIER